MTTEELEQLMKAHKCGFVLESNNDGFKCELDDGLDTLGVGSGPSIVEAVYEALKSKCKDEIHIKDLFGCAPNATGGVDSVTFVRNIRDEWDKE